MNPAKNPDTDREAPGGTWTQQRIARLLSSVFVRNVAVVASGTAGAQAITIAFAPLITRLYGPEAYGVLGTFSAILAIASALAALNYPLAIVLPERDEDAAALALLSLLIALVASSLLLLILIAFHAALARWLELEALGPLLLLMPFALLFSTCVIVLKQWGIREKQFPILAKAELLQSIANNGAKAAIGSFIPTSAVLVGVTTLAPLLQTCLLFAGLKRPGRLGRFLSAQGRALVSIALRYRDFPLYRAPQNALNAVSQGLPVFLLAALAGPPAAGFYTLSRTVMALPSMLLAQSVGDVFYPRISEAHRLEEKRFRLILRATIALAGVGLAPFSLVIAFGPALFGFVFGEEWRPAGEYSRWMAIWLFSNFINRPCVVAIPVFALQHVLLIYEIGALVFRVSALVVGLLVLKSDLHAVALFSVVNSALNLVLIYVTLRVARRADR